jgi:N-hydroxyarylamine O-acetyltransferase
MLADDVMQSYLARVGYAGEPSATLQTLTALHALHPVAIPFENIDVLMRRTISLDPRRIAEKLVTGGRGGYCYEHNMLFLAVLRTLGIPAISIGARVLWNTPAGEMLPRSHMLLLADVSGERYIADVGFGRLTLDAPLRLEPDVEQPTGRGVYRVVRSGDEMQLHTRLGADWTALYQFSLQEQLPVDWEVVHWHTSTHPSSIFTRSLMVSRSDDARRYALLDNRLRTYDRGGLIDQRRLETPDDIRETLRDIFRIALPTGCDQVLAYAARASE